ncbi:nicotinate (nicotinamide) nucleotide adenylyltransferase [Poseidonibacter parvus]|uniref:nicotinate (nicotinamide) nucleotide adenylyltransferase n=1 Tax=Poseidonibacter parvus TaxID=1850254 RepID=UPI0009FA9765|nr:nicotinate (nicotinamide) nucleotide adenylyltransferase [Poseidonibacter parvus]
MRLAVFGGSFDPVHIAHEAIVNEALKELNIDKLIVVPTYLNPFKNSFNYEPNIREQLLRKVFSKTSKVEICDYEVKQKRAVYSIETIKYLKNLYKPSKIYLIIGADNVKDLNKWQGIEELKSLVDFVVASRSGFIDNNFTKFKNLKVDIDISSTKLRDKIDLNFIPIQIKEDIINLQRNKKG